jgi:hypothetical protein
LEGGAFAAVPSRRLLARFFIPEILSDAVDEELNLSANLASIRIENYTIDGKLAPVAEPKRRMSFPFVEMPDAIVPQLRATPETREDSTADHFLFERDSTP